MKLLSRNLERFRRGAGTDMLDTLTTHAYALSYTNDLEIIMHNERQVSLFRNGRNQAIRIPRDFELEGTEAVIRKEGDKLIIEPVRKKNLKELLATLPMLDEDFPELVDSIVEPKDIF